MINFNCNCNDLFQYRNRYNKIFGGFIMRQACELAFTNAYIYG
jgi:hypothetical protein